MTQEDLLCRLSAQLPQLEKSAVGVKDYVTMRLKSASDLPVVAEILKNELGFDYFEIVSATDWLGPVKPEGYIRNPNPNIFLPEGATPQNFPAATPGVNYRPAFELLWVFGNISQSIKLFL